VVPGHGGLVGRHPHAQRPTRAAGYFHWDWQHLPGREYDTTNAADLTVHHLAYLDDSVPVEEPPWLTRFLPESGNAVFRNSWDGDAVWMMLVAEHGSARKTLHDHVDGTSFSLAAYGEYLLMDTGYYKPSSLDNARTANAPSHNVILIDGEGAPTRGYLDDFTGDADAFLENTLDGAHFDYAEARTAYQDNDIVRSVVFARGLYSVVADRLTTTNATPREYRWRLHGNAGLSAGGTFTQGADGGTWTRTAAGVEQHLASTAPGLGFEQPPFVDLEAPHCHDIDGTPGNHVVLDGVVSASAPGFLAVLAPFRVGGARALTVTPVASGDGHAAWRVDHPDGSDLVWLRQASSPATLTLGDGRVVGTDAAFIILGLDDDAAVIARGTQVTVDGAVVATAAASAGVGDSAP
jgi:hypothetical protein